MKTALLRTRFGQAHAAVYADRADVDEVVVFGRIPQKLTKISNQFGSPRPRTWTPYLPIPGWTSWTSVYPPTMLHADTAVPAMEACKDVLIELPLVRTREPGINLRGLRSGHDHPERVSENHR